MTSTCQTLPMHTPLEKSAGSAAAITSLYARKWRARIHWPETSTWTKRRKVGQQPSEVGASVSIRFTSVTEDNRREPLFRQTGRWSTPASSRCSPRLPCRGLCSASTASAPCCRPYIAGRRRPLVTSGSMMTSSVPCARKSESQAATHRASSPPTVYARVRRRTDAW